MLLLLLLDEQLNIYSFESVDDPLGIVFLWVVIQHESPDELGEFILLDGFSDVPHEAKLKCDVVDGDEMTRRSLLVNGVDVSPTKKEKGQQFSSWNSFELIPSIAVSPLRTGCDFCRSSSRSPPPKVRTPFSSP